MARSCLVHLKMFTCFILPTLAGRNRWVEYADRVYLDYDGSQVPAEWFGWLHYKTDLPPHKVK